MPAMNTLEMLLVEDSHGDVVLVKEALKQAAVTVSLNVVYDGEAALAFLHKQEPYAQAQTPDLMLLDLNMPKKSGREVLAALKSDPALKDIPVVILTSSSKEQDIRDSYALCANLYLQKPLELDAYFEKIRALVEFWAKHVTPPPR
jgi:CheY-like chemotaxis protein